MAEETSNRPVVQFCVDLYRAADYFLLEPILPIVQHRLGDHCDEKLKWLCTFRNEQDVEAIRTALPWIKDLVKGIEEAYKWNTREIKKTLMEFVWAGRHRLLAGGLTGIQDDLDSTPAFFKDMLRHSTTSSFNGAFWAPRTLSVRLNYLRPTFCARCNRQLETRADDPDTYGQVWDPFTASNDNRILRRWCKECAAMDRIPWRETGS